MEHSYYQDRLSAYHDNELPLQEKVVVEEHLRECAECRDLLVQYEKLDQLVASHGNLADGDYWEKAAHRIDRAIAGAQATDVEDITPKKRGYLVWKLLPIAASIVIVGYIGLHRNEIFQPGPGTPQVSPEIPARVESIPARPPSDGTVQRNNEALSVPAEKEKQSTANQSTKKSLAGESARLQEVRPKRNDEPALTPASTGADAGSISSKTDQSAGSAATDNMAIAQKAVAAPSAAMPENADYKKSRSELALDSASPAAVADTGLGLAHWVHVRDSLLVVVGKDTKGKSVQALADKITSGYARAGRTPSGLVATDTKVDPVQSLAEASYWVAKLSSADAVRTSAIGTLKDLATKSSPAEREKIQSYLKELGAQ